MEQSYKTTAVLIKKRDWRESDLLFSFYAEKFGRVEAVAVGAKKILSKLSGHLSLGGLVEIDFIKGKNFYKLTHAYQLQKPEITDWQDLIFWSGAVEILLKGTPLEEPNAFVWRLLGWYRKQLGSTENFGEKSLLRSLFAIKFLQTAGYKLIVDKCPVCEKSLNNSSRIDFNAGGFICSECGTKNVASEIFTLIKQLQESPGTGALWSKKDEQALAHFSKQYAEYYLGCELISWR